MDSLKRVREPEHDESGSSEGAANVSALPERGERQRTQTQREPVSEDQPDGSSDTRSAPGPQTSGGSNGTFSSTRVMPVSAKRLLENRIVATADRDPAAIAYKVLRTHVLQRMRANNWKTLAWFF